MSDLFDTIERLLALKELTPEAIGKVLKTSLTPRRDANPFYRFYEATLPVGPFSRAELQEPGSGATSQDRRLNLVVAAGRETTLRDVGGRFGPSSIYQIIPEAGPEGLVTHAYPQKEGKLFLQFTGKSGKLLNVTICRGRCD